MKKTVLVFSVIILCLVFTACGGDTKNDGNNVTIRTVDEIEEYKVVRGDNCGNEEKEVVIDFHQALYKSFKTIKICTDFNPSEDKEILIGHTNRPESIEAHKGLRRDDYVIKKVGSKIVVAAGSVEALKTAAELFKNNFIDSTNRKVKVPTGEGYKYVGTYTVDNLTVNGTPITEFHLFNKSLLKTEETAKKIGSAFGFEPIVDDEIHKNTKYIIIDGTHLIADEYKIIVEDENVIIRGSHHTIETAIEFFINDFFDKIGKREYNLTSADNLEASIGKPEIYTKEQLMTVINQVYDDPNKIIIGEEVQGGTKANTVANCIQKFVDATGEMPGIMGIDLACYGIDLMKTNDATWSAFICDIVDYCAGGGLITASAHWENPSGNTMGSARCRGKLGYEDSMEAYQKGFEDLITEGTEYNTFFKRELDVNARFLKALQDNGVTMIWRPLHEANGGWFWFCTTQGNGKTLPASCVVNVWHYVHDYFTNHHGLTNLIWNYAPNTSANVNDTPGSTMSTTYLYPGDEYCDIVGVDWYSGGKLEIMKGDNYLRLIDLSRKPGAITEFGPSGSILAEEIEKQPELYNSLDLYGNLFELSREGYSFVYLLTWGGKWGIPAMGMGEEFMDKEMTLGQAEVKAMFDALK